MEYLWCHLCKVSIIFFVLIDAIVLIEWEISFLIEVSAAVATATMVSGEATEFKVFCRRGDLRDVIIVFDDERERF